LPRYLADSAIDSGERVQVLRAFPLPSQEINVVSPSPRFVPSKVLALTKPTDLNVA